MGKLDARRCVSTQCGPQAKDHSAGLKEGDLVIRLMCVVPSHRFVEGAGAGEIFHAKGHKADPLLHLTKYVSARRCRSWSPRTARSRSTCRSRATADCCAAR